MKFSLLTYNILFNKAFPQLPAILDKYKPDILCLQEIDTQEENLKKMEVFGYRLADFANCSIDYGQIWGVATYYNQKTFEFLNSKPIPLINGLYEIIKIIVRLFRNKGLKRTILKTTLKTKFLKKNVTVYNIHLSTISLNTLRVKQLNMIDFDDFEQKGSIIITGDFNFPVERKKLEKIMSRYQLKEATNNLFYTLRYPNNPNEYKYGLIHKIFLKFARRFWTNEVKLDYIFYRGLKNISTKRLNYSYSDHFPVIAQFEID